MEDMYLIDANIFITAHRQYYSFDIAPSFWKQIVEKASNKIVIIEKVKNELLKGGDSLTEWFNSVCSNFTVLDNPDQNVIEAYSEIISSVNENNQYKQTVKDTFAQAADSWLCAYGLANNHTIVTLETFEPDSKKRIKIPNICKEHGIRCINLSQFMREVHMSL